MRPRKEDKQVLHCNVQTKTSFYGRRRGHWMKEKALTGGKSHVPRVGQNEKSAEVIVVIGNEPTQTNQTSNHLSYHHRI